MHSRIVGRGRAFHDVFSALLIVGASLGGCAGGNGNAPPAVANDGSDSATFDTALDRISLGEPGTYGFRIENLPQTSLTALLAVEPSDEETRVALDHAGVRVRMTIRGERAAGEPVQLIVRDGRLEGEWSKTFESWAGRPLEYIAATFKPRRHDVYTVIVQVTPGAPLGREVYAVPHVRAAGLASSSGMRATGDDAAEPAANAVAPARAE